MKSFESVLSRYKGIGPGFDFLRIGLAISIVLTHAALLTERTWLRDTPLWFVEYALVPMFFALSGFLVAGSAMRLSLKNFLINRGLRIIPALAVDVVVCALIIGPLMTTVPLAQYFTDKDFFKYFLNITGWIHYDLPGVFKDHFNTRVNGALWTVPYEIFCYMIMSVLIFSRWITRPWFVVVLTIGFFVFGVVIQYTTPSDREAQSLFDFALRGFFVSRGAQLLLAFLLGIVAYQFRHRIPYSWALFGLSCAACLAAIFMLDSSSLGQVPNRAILIPSLTYITVFIGLTPVPVPKIIHTGDYSYGIYLYHDPLLQVAIALLPPAFISSHFGWFGLIAVGLPPIALWAAFSWHMIEKRILALRKRFSFIAKVRNLGEVVQT